MLERQEAAAKKFSIDETASSSWHWENDHANSLQIDQNGRRNLGELQALESEFSWPICLCIAGLQATPVTIRTAH